MSRSHSGTREGRTAFIETMNQVTDKTSSKSFNKTFKETYIKHYPGATEEQIARVLAVLTKNDVWGLGYGLGTTAKAIEIAKAAPTNMEKSMLYNQYEKEKKGWEEQNFIKETAAEPSMENQKKEDLDKLFTQQEQELIKKLNILQRKQGLKDIEESDYFKDMKAATEQQHKEKAYERFSAIAKDFALYRDLEHDSALLHEMYKRREQRELSEAQDKQKAREDYEEAVKSYNADTSSSKGAPPEKSRPDITPTVEVKKFEEDTKAEAQYKKLNAKNVGKINNNKKFDKEDNNTNVAPTVKKSAIRKAFEKQRNRLKMMRPHIKFTRLGAKTKADTSKII